MGIRTQYIFNPLNHFRALWLPASIPVAICIIFFLAGGSDFSGLPTLFSKLLPAFIVLLAPVVLLHLEHCVCSKWKIAYHPDHVVLSGIGRSDKVHYDEIRFVKEIGSKRNNGPSGGQDHYYCFRIQTKSGKRHYISCLLDPDFLKNVGHYQKGLVHYRITMVLPSILFDRFRK